MSASRFVRACRSALLISMKATGSKSNLSGKLSFRYMPVKQIVNIKYFRTATQPAEGSRKYTAITGTGVPRRFNPGNGPREGPTPPRD
jgi:hypothetical protein